MKLEPTNHPAAGLTLIEVLVIIAILAVLAYVLLAPSLHSAPRPGRINCVNNLRQIQLALKTWAVEHDGQNPMQLSSTNSGTRESLLRGSVLATWLTMSNELSTPKLLVCPSDEERKRAPSFGELVNQNISYFISLDATTNESTSVLFGDRNLTLNGTPVQPGLVPLTTNGLPGWTDAIHHRQGNIGLLDGSIQQVTVNRLRTTLQVIGDRTNRVAVP